MHTVIEVWEWAGDFPFLISFQWCTGCCWLLEPARCFHVLWKLFHALLICFVCIFVGKKKLSFLCQITLSFSVCTVAEWSFMLSSQTCGWTLEAKSSGFWDHLTVSWVIETSDMLGCELPTPHPPHHFWKQIPHPSPSMVSCRFAPWGPLWD